MRKIYSYQKILRLYRRFQFHLSGFILAVVGIWIFWQMTKQTTVPDWIFYLAGFWILILVIELFRFIYVYNSRRANKRRTK